MKIYHRAYGYLRKGTEKNENDTINSKNDTTNDTITAENDTINDTINELSDKERQIFDSIKQENNITAHKIATQLNISISFHPHHIPLLFLHRTGRADRAWYRSVRHSGYRE